MTEDRPDMVEDTLDMTVERNSLRSLDMTKDKPDMVEDTLDMTVERNSLRSLYMKKMQGNRIKFER